LVLNETRKQNHIIAWYQNPPGFTEPGKITWLKLKKNPPNHEPKNAIKIKIKPNKVNGSKTL
jgi:hypothetical protein